MDFQKAGSNKRVCAFGIDYVIFLILGGLVSLVLARNIMPVAALILILFKDCFNGRSIGRYLVGTQVIDENNLPAKPAKTIIRNIFMIIPIFPLIEYFIMLKDKQEGRRIGDKLAKTKVNDLKPQVKDSVFLWVSIGVAIIAAVILMGITFLITEQQVKLIGTTETGSL